MDLPMGWHKPVCGAEFLNDWRWGKLRGHVNWRPATVSGYLTWNDAAGRYPLGDSDYTLFLEPAEADGTKRLPGLTRYNKVKGHATHAYHIEFNAAETVDHFTQEWWVAHREKVSGGTAGASGAPERGQIPNGTYAVVTGLFGLDAEHKGHSELHPVYAMSVLTSCATEPDAQGFFDDEWAVFVRNWGNEGFCADWKAYHMVDFPDGVYAFQIPLPGVDPSSVALGAKTRVFANHPHAGEATRPGKGPFLVAAPDSVEVRFQLPEMSGSITRANDAPRLHGLLHMRWKARAGAQTRACPRQTPPPDVAAAGLPREGTDAEDVLRRMQRQRVEAGLGRPNEATVLTAPGDALEVTDRGPIPPAEASHELWDRVVRVPRTATETGALVREVDEAAPPEACAAAEVLLQLESRASLEQETARRLEELRAYCERTRRVAEARSLLQAAIEAPDSAEHVDAWLATLPRIDNYYVVEGDIRKTEGQLRAWLEQQHRSPREPSGEISVNLENGVPTYWKDPVSRHLTYAVDRRSFPDAAAYTAVANAVERATRDWQDACPQCGLDFAHLVEHDNAPSHDLVTFIVRFRKEASSYVALAFYPNDPPLARYLDIFPAYIAGSGYDPIGVLRHELGHVLGYRHAHLGVPGCALEQGQWLALTPYDSRSVMHYLCGGGGDQTLALSALDREGHRKLYGGR